MDNRLLSTNKEVRDHLVQLIHYFQLVLTIGDVVGSKTELLKMRIVLSKDAVPVRAPVRKIKPHLLGSHMTHIDSWLRDGIISPAVSLSGSTLAPVAKKNGRWTVEQILIQCLRKVVESLAGSKIFSYSDAVHSTMSP